MDVIKEWYQRHFSDPQVVILALMLVSGFVIVLFASRILAPLFVAVVLAYLLEGVVRQMQKLRIPRLPAVTFVFLVFMVFLISVLFLLLPKITRQVTMLLQELPTMLNQGEQLLLGLPERYPAMFSDSQILQWIDRIKDELTMFGEQILARTVTSVIGIITVIVYVILVPFLIFFMMKDKGRIIAWLRGYLPRDRALVKTVWLDVDRQIGNYIRGKSWEILIIWAASYIVFYLFGLPYAVLLSFLVGLSVIIPYVGAVIVTIPIAVIAYFEWGIGAYWSYLMLSYFMVQVLDANVLVPLLMSEAVDLHPVAIIVAILFFGGIWGIWGVFFAIPLATLVQAVLKAWPSRQDLQQVDQSESDA